MKIVRKININVAAKTVIVLFSCVVLFHLLVLSGLISYKNVWGGRLQSATQMYLFETVSIIINLAVIFIAGTRVGYIKAYFPKKILTVLLWVLVILFSLNTLGNLLSESQLEMLLFTPFTLICTVLFYRLAMEH